MEITPDILRQIADMMERGSAYCKAATVEMQPDREWLIGGEYVDRMPLWYGVEIRLDLREQLEFEPISIKAEIGYERRRDPDRPTKSKNKPDKQPYDLARRQKRARNHLDRYKNEFGHEGGPLWSVPSAKDSTIFYDVNVDNRTCTCQDFKDHEKPCKHVLAVELLISEAPEAAIKLLNKMVKVIISAWMNSMYDALDRLSKMIKAIVKVWAADVIEPGMIRTSLLELK